MNGSLTWFWLSLFFALYTSVLISFIKQLTQKTHYIFVIFAGNIFTLPFTFLIILLTGGIPNVTPKFYLLMTSSSIFDLIAAISSYLAISISPISLVSPISSFNPIFTTIFAALAIHEIPSPVKLVGIATIVSGAYLLNISDIKGGLFLPFKKLFTNRGVLLSLFAYLIWGITPIFQKQSIFETKPITPLFASFFGSFIVAVLVFPILIIKVKNISLQIRKTWTWFFMIRPYSALAQLAAFTAVTQADLGLLTSVFKVAVVFTILGGLLFFKEERIWERLLGAGVMIAGTILLLK